MQSTTAIVGLIVLALAIPLAVVLIKFNLKRRKIIQCAATASPKQLETIYSAIEKSGTETPTTAVLARLNQSSGPIDFQLVIPPCVEPWGGMEIEPVIGKEVVLRLKTSAESQSYLHARPFRMVLVPRHRTKSGKERNTYSPDDYFKRIPEVAAECKRICPDYPRELLGYLFNTSIESHEFDPIFQVRLGGSASWIQEPEFKSCPVCKKRMIHIAQIPGAMLPGKAPDKGNFYLLGCREHLGETCTIEQFT